MYSIYTIKRSTSFSWHLYVISTLTLIDNECNKILKVAICYKFIIVVTIPTIGWETVEYINKRGWIHINDARVGLHCY